MTGVCISTGGRLRNIA